MNAKTKKWRSDKTGKGRGCSCREVRGASREEAKAFQKAGEVGTCWEPTSPNGKRNPGVLLVNGKGKRSEKPQWLIREQPPIHSTRAADRGRRAQVPARRSGQIPTRQGTHHATRTKKNHHFGESLTTKGEKKKASKDIGLEDMQKG